MRWGAGAVALACAALYAAERRRPLRPPVWRWRRQARNVVIALSGGLGSALVERPGVAWALSQVRQRRLGLQRLGLPGWLETTAALLLLDYTLYLWHVLTHRVPFLWRFHSVHHADRDMDASTALRFHFGEMVLSAPFRAFQILLIGVSPRALAIWRGLLLVSITFHHANLRLPVSWERRLSWLVVTPRLHGRHHDVDPSVRHCNWSSGLAVWDWLHGTLVRDLRDLPRPLGLPGLRAERHLTVGAMLALPLHRPGA